MFFTHFTFCAIFLWLVSHSNECAMNFKLVCRISSICHLMSWNNAPFCVCYVNFHAEFTLFCTAILIYCMFQYANRSCSCMVYYGSLWCYVCMHITNKTSACMHTTVHLYMKTFCHISMSEIALTCATDFQLLAIHTHAHTLPGLHSFCPVLLSLSFSVSSVTPFWNGL